jgi:hypothetical protein
VAILLTIIGNVLARSCRWWLAFKAIVR